MIKSIAYALSIITIVGFLASCGSEQKPAAPDSVSLCLLVSLCVLGTSWRSIPVLICEGVHCVRAGVDAAVGQC